MSQQSTLGRTATTIATVNSETHVTYHSTVVVAFDSRSVTLDSGGWRTATTKSRMNQASNQFGLGYQVFQKDFDWFVRLPDGSTVDFYDGITFAR